LAANKSNTNKRTSARKGLRAQIEIHLIFNILHTICDCLSLTLLVASILADDAHDTVATDNLAVATDALH
jgi:hypothetical protein